MPDPAPGERRRVPRKRPSADVAESPTRIKRVSLNLSLPPDLVAELYGLAALRGHGGRVSTFLEPHLRELTRGMVHYERPAATASAPPGKGTESRGGGPTLALTAAGDDDDQPPAA